VASTEKTFAKYLLDLVVPSTDRPRVTAKAKAIKSYAMINDLLVELKALETAKAKAERLNPKKEKIRLQYSVLARAIKILGIDGSRPETVRTHITPAAGRKLDSIEARPLTALPGDIPGDPDAGKVRGVPGWDFLDLINIHRGGDRKIYDGWVRWHLIHSEMHGPAAVFNLVAAPRGDNTNLGRRVEKDVLRLIREPGTMLYYKVKIVYGNQAPPLDDFPTSISYRWGRMKLGAGNRPEEDGLINTVSFEDFPKPALPGATDAEPGVIRLKKLGRDTMNKVLHLPIHIAARIRRACLAFPDRSVYAAMNAFYDDPTNVYVDGKRFALHLEGDKAAIVAAQARVSGKFKVDLT
jgi:hypothetical protein